MSVIATALVTELYGVADHKVLLIERDLAKAIQISIPRPFIQGKVPDGDSMGGQQYAPLVKLKIP